jgi:hypothetical protein
MAVISTPFTGQRTSLYAKTTALALESLAAGDLVGEVNSIGDIELSRNMIEINSYGSDYKSQLPGQKASGTVDITLNWVPDATAAAAALLRTAYDSGAKTYFAVVWQDGPTDAVPANTKVAACTFSGYISSYALSQPLEDVVTANVTITIDQGVTFDLDGTLGG